MADIFILHHTSVDLKGINMEMTFLKGLLDTVSIVPEVEISLTKLLVTLCSMKKCQMK